MRARSSIPAVTASASRPNSSLAEAAAADEGSASAATTEEDGGEGSASAAAMEEDGGEGSASTGAAAGGEMGSSIGLVISLGLAWSRLISSDLFRSPRLRLT
jgi:hypothetical protein